MKLVIAMMMAVAAASAIEDSVDQLVKICGNDMAKALQEACEHKSVEYLLKHGKYNPQREEDHKHQHHDHHHRDENHDHGHDGHNHTHAHDHDHDIHRDNRSHAEKSAINENDRSIKEECCLKPCLVKDFTSFCG